MRPERAAGLRSSTAQSWDFGQGPASTSRAQDSFPSVRGLRVSLNSLLLLCPWLQVEWVTVEAGSLSHTPPCNLGWWLFLHLLAHSIYTPWGPRKPFICRSGSSKSR